MLIHEQGGQVNQLVLLHGQRSVVMYCSTSVAVLPAAALVDRREFPLVTWLAALLAVSGCGGERSQPLAPGALRALCKSERSSQWAPVRPDATRLSIAVRYRSVSRRATPAPLSPE